VVLHCLLDRRWTGSHLLHSVQPGRGLHSHRQGARRRHEHAIPDASLPSEATSPALRTIRICCLPRTLLWISIWPLQLLNNQKGDQQSSQTQCCSIPDFKNICDRSNHCYNALRPDQVRTWTSPEWLAWFWFWIAVIIREIITYWRSVWALPPVHDWSHYVGQMFMTFSLKIHSEFEFLLKDMEPSWVTFSLGKTLAWLITKFLIRVIHNLFGPFSDAWIGSRIQKIHSFSTSGYLPAIREIIFFNTCSKVSQELPFCYVIDKISAARVIPSFAVKKILLMAL